MRDKIKLVRNWAAVGAVVFFALGIALGVYSGWLTLPWTWAPSEEQLGEFDPIAAGNRIEEACPNIDVMHIGVSSSLMLGNDVFHVGVRFWHEENLRAIELTDTGWNILAPGEYTWEPGQEEPVYDQWHFWTEAKYEYFSDNAMFRPGDVDRIKPAIADLYRWHDDWLTTRLLNAIFLEAMPYYDQWTAIEISYLGLGEPAQKPGIVSGEPGYVYVCEPYIGVVEYVFKKLADTPEGEGYWIIDAMERGGLTIEEYRELRELQAIYMMPGFHPLFGAVPYTHGFNHPWQARALEEQS